jgi:hypothetical protein
LYEWGEIRNAYKTLVAKPDKKKPLGRPRCRRKDNNKIDLKEIGCMSVEWIQLAQDMVQWRFLRVMKHRIS